MILFQLEIKPGSIVVESGTGSGSLSHSFLRAVKPFGHLHTFDFHEQRCDIARDEFKSHGIADFVTVGVIYFFGFMKEKWCYFYEKMSFQLQVYHRDVCEKGFTNELNGKVDAVFLDLPAPHLAVPHALKALKHSGNIDKSKYVHSFTVINILFASHRI